MLSFVCDRKNLRNSLTGANHLKTNALNAPVEVTPAIASAIDKLHEGHIEFAPNSLILTAACQFLDWPYFDASEAYGWNLRR